MAVLALLVGLATLAAVLAGAFAVGYGVARMVIRLLTGR